MTKKEVLIRLCCLTATIGNQLYNITGQSFSRDCFCEQKEEEMKKFGLPWCFSAEIIGFLEDAAEKKFQRMEG